MNIERIQAQSALTEYLTMLRDITSRNMGDTPTDLHYRGGPTDLVLQHGSWFTPSTLLPPTGRGELQQCFYNAATAATHFGLRYIEGYAVGIIPVHHAWCADDNDRVYEVTWKEPGIAYFGIEFDPKLVFDYKRRMSSSVLNNEYRMDIYRKPFVPLEHPMRRKKVNHARRFVAGKHRR